jgi:hypothetical protein
VKARGHRARRVEARPGALDEAVQLPETQRESGAVPLRVHTGHAEHGGVDVVNVGGNHEGRQYATLCGMSSRAPVVAALALVISAPLVAADWPQLLGPTRNGVYAGPPLAEKWPAAGPRVVWRRTVGQGLSGPV